MTNPAPPLANTTLVFAVTSGYAVDSATGNDVPLTISGVYYATLKQSRDPRYEQRLGVDETAERILTLGTRPFSSYEEYIENSEIKEAKKIHDSKNMVEIVRDNLNTLLKLEREALEAATEQGDEGTVSLMSDYITAKEKTVWMLSAYLR